MDNDKIIIPHSELKNTLDDCFEHLIYLQKNSKHNYYNHDYNMSIFFSIILFEEITKYSIYSKCYRAKKDLKQKEFNNLLDHKFKLQKIVLTEFEDNFNKIQNFDLSENLKNKIKNNPNYLKERYLRFFNSFNLLKQFALYHNWRGNRSLTLNKMILKINIDHLANFLLNLSTFVFNRECLIHKYNIDSLTKNKNVIPPSDPLLIFCSNFVKLFNSKEYEVTKHKVFLTVDEVYFLNQYLKKII